MSLESEIFSELHQLLSEHGMRARRKDLSLLVLVSQVRNDPQIEMGGFVESPVLRLHLPKRAFPDVIPKFGERIAVDHTDPLHLIDTARSA